MSIFKISKSSFFFRARIFIIAVSLISVSLEKSKISSPTISNHIFQDAYTIWNSISSNENLYHNPNENFPTIKFVTARRRYSLRKRKIQKLAKFQKLQKSTAVSTVAGSDSAAQNLIDVQTEKAAILGILWLTWFVSGIIAMLGSFSETQKGFCGTQCPALWPSSITNAVAQTGVSCWIFMMFGEHISADRRAKATRLLPLVFFIPAIIATWNFSETLKSHDYCDAESGVDIKFMQVWNYISSVIGFIDYLIFGVGLAKVIGPYIPYTDERSREKEYRRWHKNATQQEKADRAAHDRKLWMMAAGQQKQAKEDARALKEKNRPKFKKGFGWMGSLGVGSNKVSPNNPTNESNSDDTGKYLDSIVDVQKASRPYFLAASGARASQLPPIQFGADRYDAEGRLKIPKDNIMGVITIGYGGAVQKVPVHQAHDFFEEQRRRNANYVRQVREEDRLRQGNPHLKAPPTEVEKRNKRFRLMVKHAALASRGLKHKGTHIRLNTRIKGMTQEELAHARVARAGNRWESDMWQTVEGEAKLKKDGSAVRDLRRFDRDRKQQKKADARKAHREAQKKKALGHADMISEV